MNAQPRSAGHGCNGVMSQSQVAKALGLTKRQVQVAEQSAFNKIRAAYKKILANDGLLT